jgi:hypothetical protein
MFAFEFLTHLEEAAGEFCKTEGGYLVDVTECLEGNQLAFYTVFEPAHVMNGTIKRVILIYCVTV